MDLEPIFKSVVALRATIPDTAFTANTLGTIREGSGVVIGDNGLVLTIGYLITEAEEVWLTTGQGTVVAAHALAYDQETGFGLVQALGPLDLPALEFGDSAASKIGDDIIFGDGAGRFVRGVVVAKQEFAGYWEYLLDEAIFIAPAHPSWGGAALVDQDGKLLGIGSLRLQMMQGGEAADINMVVPINLLPPILEDLKTRGRVDKPPRPWLGLYCADQEEGVVVASVAAKGPAEKAGIRPGDRILGLDDSEAPDLAGLWRSLWSRGAAGVAVNVAAERDGRRLVLPVVSGDRSKFLQAPRLH